MKLLAQGAEASIFDIGDKVKKVIDKRGIAYNNDYNRYGEIRFVSEYKSKFFVPVYSANEHTNEIIMKKLDRSIGGYDFVDMRIVCELGVDNVLGWLVELEKELDRLGVFHHDINPYNIMHDSSKNLYLIDFGWASTYALDKYPPQLNIFYSHNDKEAIKKIKQEIEAKIKRGDG